MSEKMPDKLKELGIFTPQESIAKAIEHLSDADRIKMLSTIRKEKDVNKFVLAYSMGRELKYQWLLDIADDMLQLYVSTDKGRGRRDIVTVVANQEKQGIMNRLKDKIKDFVSSGE